MQKTTFAKLTPTQRKLVRSAVAVRKRAYAPYSHYKVGAALLDVKNRMHTGCNVEGADYTLTTHAEMGAINAMVKSGTLKLKAIAVVVKSEVGQGMPCGLCRQKIREFALNLAVPVIGVNLDAQEKIGSIFVSSLQELLPFAFGPDFL